MELGYGITVWNHTGQRHVNALLLLARKISLQSPCLRKKLCYDENCWIRSCVRSGYREEKMAMIATIFAVGSAIGAVLFSLWMLKQLFASN
jgi:hypothetical protein